ncbi:MAG: heat-inducible transcriptional repressor HrcA [Bacilli bacterium]|jgi:heat-inducible transcriptional repressor
MELRRRELILKYTVELFIKTAVPVGSNTLLENYHLPYSSATIRAEMNALEESGYLEKPHVSSGRVPSSKGYRYYIDHLRGNKVDENMKMQIQSIIDEQTRTVDEVIKATCEILANMTNLASVVLGPSSAKETLKSIEIIPLSSRTATAVFITNQGYVEHKTFLLPSDTSIQQLDKVAQIFNERLQGTRICDVIPKMESLKPLLSDYVIETQVIYDAFSEAFIKYAKDRLSLYGKESLLEQPEFVNDAEKLRKLIAILDDPEQIKQLAAHEGDFAINIAEDDEELSVITLKFNIPGREGGQIALVGPKRMDYGLVINALEYVTDALEKYFEEREELNE